METGRAALFFEPGKPMTLTEFPVVEPAPGSVLVRVTRANVCGSDLHFWRGDGRLERWIRQDGAIIGHEMTGVVHALGEGVATDWAGAPLAVGDKDKAKEALLNVDVLTGTTLGAGGRGAR